MQHLFALIINNFNTKYNMVQPPNDRSTYNPSNQLSLVDI